MSHPYTEDYFMRGPETGLSNYRGYRWLPDLTLPMADQARWLLNIRPNDVVLDYGCSRGYFVKALRQRGVTAWGYDISEWALENCDPAVKEFVSNDLHLPDKGWDVIWSKDVFEHIPESQLEHLVPKMLSACRRQVFLIIPLAIHRGGPYACPVDELDKTHVIRWTLPCWLDFLQKFSRDFVVSGGYEMPVLKQNCYHYPRSYGFITARRIAS